MIKRFFKVNTHYLLLLYAPVYMFLFTLLEHRKCASIYILNTSIDKYIPFCEYFVIPYLLWFLYMFAFGAFFAIWDKEAFVKMMVFGIIGMSVFLLVSYIYPNGIELRPNLNGKEGVCIRLVKIIYEKDTATNVLPSIHVFNSIGVLDAVIHSKSLKNNNTVKMISLLLTCFIILSTMFIKQHSALDVVAGIALAIICHEIVFGNSSQFGECIQLANAEKENIPFKWR